MWAEVEYAADVNYQQEAEKEGVTENGKYRHSYAGLKHLPTDGYYRYRTNPNPETDPWIITGAMKVNRVLTNEEVDDLVRSCVYHSNFITLQSKTTFIYLFCMVLQLCISLKFCNFVIQNKQPT